MTPRFGPTLFVLAALVTASSDAQDIRIDWSRAKPTKAVTLRAGRQVTVVVSELNSLCYTYRLDHAQVESPPETAQVSTALQALSKPEAASKVELPQALAATGSAKPGGQVVIKSALPDPRDGARAALDSIHKRVAQLVGALTTHQQEVAVVVRKRTAADSLQQAFLATHCQKAVRASSGARSAWQAETSTTKPGGIADFATLNADSLAGRTNQLITTTSNVGRELAGVKGLPAYKAAFALPEFQLDALRLELKLAEITEETKKLNATLGGIRRDQSSVRSWIAIIDTRLKPDSLQEVIHLAPAAERLDLTIKATGRPDVPTVAKEEITDKFSFPVRRRTRVVNTIGFLLSGLDQHEYGRVTLPRASGDTNAVTDSIYSTYLDRGNSDNLAFAPAVQSSLTIAGDGPFAAALTAGLAARSVRGKIGPDLLAGVSVVVGDQLTVSLLRHWGRREVLLLGDPADVARRPVPILVTDDSAIGTSWASAWAVSVAWKIPTGK